MDFGSSNGYPEGKPNPKDLNSAASSLRVAAVGQDADLDSG